MDEALAQKLFPAVNEAQLGVSGAIALAQFRQRTPVHAYLISGAKGLGKSTFAKVLACTLFCEAEEGRPCGTCAACQSVWQEQNPDVMRVSPEGSKQIGVEKIREVTDVISQYAFGQGYRVVVVEPAERMTPQAQNCLLKSLEEPAAQVVFLLIAHELTALLGTIASRCARVKLSPWTDEMLTTALQRLGYGETEIMQALPVAGGNMGQALEWLAEKGQNQGLHQFLEQALTVGSDADVVRISTGLKEDREGAERYLNGLEQAIHQALLVRTGQLSAAALKGYPQVWQQSVEKAPVEGLTALLRAVFEARKLRAGQVNWQSNMDHLMMKILKERKRWQQS